jgi:hypothetical protein
LNDAQSTPPPGYCQCGCGRLTGLARENNVAKGWKKGEPLRYIVGHGFTKARLTDSEERARHRQLWEDAGIPYGLCLCGCGEMTTIATARRIDRGRIPGEPHRFVHAHGARRREIYHEENRGYDTPCWIYEGPSTRGGYGRLCDGGGKSRGAHVVMWERTNGPVPRGLHLDHLCTVRACIRPDHLEPVTPAENTRRSRIAKLTHTAVAEIRAQLRRGDDIGALAAEFGVSRRTINDIKAGRSWQEDHGAQHPRTTTAPCEYRRDSAERASGTLGSR